MNNLYGWQTLQVTQEMKKYKDAAKLIRFIKFLQASSSPKSQY